MITYSKIISDLEIIYQMSLSEGNLSVAMKAKELQSRQIEFINKTEKENHHLKAIKIDNLIKLAQNQLKKQRKT